MTTPTRSRACRACWACIGSTSSGPRRRTCCSSTARSRVGCLPSWSAPVGTPLPRAGTRTPRTPCAPWPGWRTSRNGWWRRAASTGARWPISNGCWRRNTDRRRARRRGADVATRRVLADDASAASAAVELGGALLEERSRSFLHVFGRGGHAEQVRFDLEALVEGHVEPTHHGFLREPEGDGGVLRRLARQLHGARQGVVGHSVHEAHRQRLVGADVATGEDHVERAPLPDEAREALGATVTGDQAETHFREAELRGGRGHAHVGRQRELQAAAEREAV